MLRTLFVVLFISGLTSLNAQEKKAFNSGKSVHFDVSKELRDITPIQPGVRVRTWKNKMVPNKLSIPNDLKDMAPLEGGDPVLQDNMRNTTTSGTIGQNFPGVSNLSGVAPPDTQGDVGPDHYFQMVNSAFAIWDKQGNILYGPVDNITLWDGFDGPWSSTNDGDPVVLYDEYADRWIATQFSLPNGSGSAPYYELVAVSQTGDPLGAWNRYAFEFDKMPDYPKFGVWHDGYYMTTHKFSSGNWAGAGLTVFEREAMVNGDAEAQMVEFHVGSGFYGILAADADGDTPPSDETPAYLLDVGNNSLRMWEVDVDWANTSNSTLNGLGTLSTESFTTNGINITQPNGQSLDALASMTMYRLQYRKFDDYEVLLTNHTVNGGGGKAGIRWYELRKYDADWEIYQQGTFAPNDGNNRWMGSIAMNNNGDIALGYSVAGSSTNPSIRYVGQSAGAPNGLGVFDIEEGSIYEGTKSQSGVSRWGDYSCMTIDPTDGETFWFTTEYSNGGWNWRTQIASFGFMQNPTTEFSADNIVIPVGEKVNFFDETSGIPTEWEWSFEGATPATSTDRNPSDITYSTEGAFTVQLIATNIIGDDTITKEAYITTSSTILPDVNFIADKLSICVGDTVNFTDQTQYSPNQWEWTFSAAVEYANGTDATSQNPEVVFTESGEINATLKAWNLNGYAELEKPAFIVSGGFMPYYKETFEGGSYHSLGWSVDNPDSDVTWGMYEVGGTTPGIMAAGIDFSDYFAIGQRDKLISPAFNLEGLESASLGFQHAYAQKMSEGADSLLVMVSPDCGVTWTTVFADAENGSGNFATHELTSNFWPETSDDWCISGWGASCIDLDLTPWAGQPNVKVAFETYSFYGNPLLIDNVTISQYVGVEETTIEELKVYPNPATGQFKVLLPDNYSYSDVILVNQLGQIVFQTKTNGISNIIDVNLNSKLNAGMYFLKVSGSESEISTKVIIR